MDKNIVEFAKRMDVAEDKKTLIEFAEHCSHVLDLGAGTGAMAKEIAKKYGCRVDAVDKDFKAKVRQNGKGNITYYGVSIRDFLREYSKGHTYDCIIFSGVLHELNNDDLEDIKMFLPGLMARNCRILIREPLYDHYLGPVLDEDSKRFIDLISDSVSVKKAFEYKDTSKISDQCFGPGFIMFRDMGHNALFYANLAFVISYGEDSWEREKYEYRYARSIDWAKSFFDFYSRPFTGFQMYPVKDTTYRQHFINAGIPGKAFDLIQYTGLHIIIDYSRGE